MQKEVILRYCEHGEPLPFTKDDGGNMVQAGYLLYEDTYYCDIPCLLKHSEITVVQAPKLIKDDELFYTEWEIEEI